ncbi:MAG: AmmeMemoRadiSam system protein B [Ignavibacteriales bacterium]|nr:AmmeMemoRadiSam system protein B [Ignavibacteriales bacterium]
MSVIRPPAVAGSFYEADPKVLGKEVDKLLDEAAPSKINGTLLGLISPHAGYQYSGLAAAYGYKLLKERPEKPYDCVIIVGPSHREFFDGISIYSGSGYATPLGVVAVNDNVRSAIFSQSSNISLSNAGHRSEHAIEVQLPFLQRVLGSFTFVPIVIGHQTRENCFLLGEVLATIAQQYNILFIASSDLSHYHPYGTAVLLDKKVIREVEALDEDNLMRQLEEESVEACGGGPIVAVMHATKKLHANRSTILTHYNSGDVTGDKSAVVGYLSAALVRGN